MEIVLLLIIIVLVVLQVFWSEFRNKKASADSTQSMEKRLDNQRESIIRQMSQERLSMLGEFANWQNSINMSISIGRRETDEKLAALGEKVERKLLEIVEGNAGSTEKIGRLLEDKLRHIQENNEAKLGEMQRIVDEKMQETLGARISASFQNVQTSLESVQKGLGEMQSLAQDARDLKNVLTNVKTRGVFGEVLLESLLCDMLAPEQYVKNYKISGNYVEFAVKMPGRDGLAAMLPIDSKFPHEDYNRLLETSDPNETDEYRRRLYASLKKFASDIKSKYIMEGVTTHFALMFLPTEGLYAEAIRNTELVNDIRKNLNVIIVGPMTLTALLSALQIGFTTIAIEQKSVEVWNVLSSVKKSFEGMVLELDKAKRQLGTLEKTIDDLSGKRVRAVVRALKDVETADLGNIVIEEDFEESEDYA